MSKEHLNYLRRKTADEAELWAADRIEELADNLERMLWYFDSYGEKMRHNEFQRFRNGKFNTDASNSAVEFNEVMDGEIESAKEALAKVRKP